MKHFRAKSGPFLERPHFKPSEIDQICTQELRDSGLYPDSPQPIRIDRFIEKRFGIVPEYKELPSGALGYTEFSKKGVVGIVVSAALDAEGGKVAERRIRTTLAHEAGHGLLHAYLFAFNERPRGLFDEDSHRGEQILCRDVVGEDAKRRSYDGRWWEFQANRAMGALLCPRDLLNEALKLYLVPTGSLGRIALDPNRRESAIKTLADVFDVNPVVTRIRVDELYPAETGQLHL